MAEVEVQLACDLPDLPAAEQIRSWVEAVLPPEQSTTELVVRIVDLDEGQSLNREFRHRDRPTNVLSFPFDAPPEFEDQYLGDMAICAPVVATEAEEQGKSLEAHWAHMVVHGTLHLLGHDHLTDADAEAMEAIEIRILEGLGFPNPYE